MQGVKKITDKIRKDAEKQAQKLLREAKAQADAIAQENKHAADACRKKKEQEISADLQFYKGRTLSQARLNHRKAYLETREQLYRELVDEALGGVERSSVMYKKFIAALLRKNMAVLGDGIVLLCNKDDVSYLKPLASKANVRAADVALGVVFEDSDGKRINESIDAVIKRKEQLLRQDVMRLLGA